MLMLHIGLPKTGTTFLQYRIFNRQRELAYIHRPGSGFWSIENLLKRHPRALPVLSPFIERLIARSVAERDLLVSNENISINANEAWQGTGPSPARVADRLADLGRRVGGVRIVLGIRRQDQWLGSRYAESAKQFAEFGQADFERRIAALCGQQLRGAVEWLDYHATYAALGARLGNDNVLLLPSETVSDEPEAALARLQAFLGCTTFVDVYRRLLADNVGMRRNVLSAGVNRWQMRGREETLTLPDPLMERVLERFAGSNRAVAAASGLDLGRLGYY
jgi:hypothetical protein